MAFDGLVAKSVCNELDCLIGGKVTKIFQPNKNEIVLGIYSNNSNYALNLCIDSSLYRFNLTSHLKQNPQNVFGFCMLLRKNLINGIIQNIYMNGFERILFIDVLVKNDLNDTIQKTLVVELMGKHSNIILTCNNQILDSLRHLNVFDNSNRNIFPGCKYILPEKNKFDFSKDFEDFYRNILDCNISPFLLSLAISKIYTGFGQKNLHMLFNLINVNDLDNSYSNLKLAYDYIFNLVYSLNSKQPVKIENVDNDFFVVNSSENVLFNNFFIDDFYFSKEEKEKFEHTKSTIFKLLSNNISKTKNKLKNIEKKLLECKNTDKYKIYGELITANLYRLTQNVPEAVLENYYDNNNQIKVPLDESISPSQNAKKYFKKYRKLQNTKEIVEEQRKEALNALKYLDSIVFELENAKTLEELNSIYMEISDNFSNSTNTVSTNIYTKKNEKNKNQALSEPAKYIIDGYTVLVGKNNKQNDYLTCKLARNQDIWFHTKDIHGCHVVLRNTNSKDLLQDISKTSVEPSTLYKCASLAAYFSKAKHSQSVPVDYTYIKYVKKPKDAKLGMVIYTNNKTIYANSDSNFRSLQ